MDHSHYLHVYVHVSWEPARDTLTAKWNGNGFRSPGKTILVAIESNFGDCLAVDDRPRWWRPYFPSQLQLPATVRPATDRNGVVLCVSWQRSERHCSSQSDAHWRFQAANDVEWVEEAVKRYLTPLGLKSTTRWAHAQDTGEEPRFLPSSSSLRGF